MKKMKKRKTRRRTPLFLSSRKKRDRQLLGSAVSPPPIGCWARYKEGCLPCCTRLPAGAMQDATGGSPLPRWAAPPALSRFWISSPIHHRHERRQSWSSTTEIRYHNRFRVELTTPRANASEIELCVEHTG